MYFRGPGGPTAELGDISNWVNLMKTVDYVAQTAVGDAILVSASDTSSVHGCLLDGLTNRSIVCTLCMGDTGRWLFSRSFCGLQH